MNLKDENFLSKIFKEIKKERNVDFSQYRPALLSRRMMARVRLTRRDNFEQYFAYLKTHPAELDNLMDVLTVNVTEFFRDSFVFDKIEQEVVPELFAKKETLNSKTVRIWSCGSSSGEEAYSVLMAVAEFLGTKLKDYKLTIFGTDIDSVSISKAIEGVFEKSQFAKLSPERRALISKYFYDMSPSSHYWIREEWPAYMDFRYSDVIADPPLERMDMILCRNMLIYFDRKLQVDVQRLLAGALNRGGFLILGNVESLWGELKDKFIEYDRKARIYLKK